MGFGLLDGREHRGWEKMVKDVDPKDLEENLVRERVMGLMREGDDGTVWIITNIIITCQRNPDIPNDLLKFCGLLMPRLDTVNYLD